MHAFPGSYDMKLILFYARMTMMAGKLSIDHRGAGDGVGAVDSCEGVARRILDSLLEHSHLCAEFTELLVHSPAAEAEKVAAQAREAEELAAELAATAKQTAEAQVGRVRQQYHTPAYWV